MPAGLLRMRALIDRLEQHLQKYIAEGIGVAFSGGVDSSLLLAVLARLKQKKPFLLTALTMQSILQSDKEIAEAKKLASEFGVKLVEFSFDPLALDEVSQNQVDRCYFCKRAIFSQFKDYANKHGVRYLMDGTNADDLKVYRPGRKALQELGVISPLAELNINKLQIREMSAALGLATATKPAVPCFATRFEYNTLLDVQMIKKVAAGEEAIKKLFPQIGNIRLRVHQNLARIEISNEFITKFASCGAEIVAELKKLGFDYVTLDLEGFRSGSYDAALK